RPHVHDPERDQEHVRTRWSPEPGHPALGPLVPAAADRQHRLVPQGAAVAQRVLDQQGRPSRLRTRNLRLLLAACRWGLLPSNIRSLPRSVSPDVEFVMRLYDVEAALREFVSALEPETLAVDAAVALVDAFVSMEKLVA